MPLPTDTRGGLGGGEFFKAAAGNTKILILDDAIEGYEYWTTEDKPVRSETKFEEPLENAKVRKVKQKNKETGVEEEVEQPDRQRYFWAVPVYNFNTDSVEVFQITQKGIRDQLVAIQSNEDWGNPVKSYTLTLNKTGEGLKTEYKVTPNPDKEDTKAKVEEAVKAYEASPMDLKSIFF